MTKFTTVRKVMRDQRLTYFDLKRATGYSVDRLCAAVNGRRVSDKVKRSIAMALGKPYETLWSHEEQLGASNKVIG